MRGSLETSGTPVSDATIPFREALWTWARIALYSFGGPAGQIAVMHRVLVEEKGWISEQRFLHALNYAMFLPGPEAQQLMIYVGWLTHGTRGGLVAGTLFVLPGFLSILALSAMYALYVDLPVVAAVFLGIKAAVFAVVVEALLRISRRVLVNRAMGGIAAASFLAMFLFDAPFPAVVAAAGMLGYLGSRIRPERFVVLGRPRPGDTGGEGADSTADEARRPPAKLGSVRTAAVWITVWFLPLPFLLAAFGPESVFVDEAVFFSKTAVVTFGGAYAVLAYIAQQAVDVFGWLAPGEMLDGLGMAETTPGPLIQVVQFVGFLGAYRNPGALDPLTAGLLGSVVTTWFTFAPCFLWIFLGAPYIEHLRGKRGLSGALSAITSAVVGVILNLAIWFGLHVAFGAVGQREWNGMLVTVPELDTISLPSVLITALACVSLFALKWGMFRTLGLACAAGIGWHLVA